MGDIYDALHEIVAMHVPTEERDEADLFIYLAKRRATEAEEQLWMLLENMIRGGQI